METQRKMVDETLYGKSSEIGNRKPKVSGTSPSRSQLSLEICEILELDLDESHLETKYLEKSVAPEKVKCCPTVIGGAGMTFGCCQLTMPRICSALYCRDCDLPVSSFQHHEWIEPVEYLFLRTNMPNFEKVSEKLIRKEGSVAYACHCASFSTEKPQPLCEVSLPWFCRGHLTKEFFN